MKSSLSSPVLTAQAMREADRQTIEWFGIPGFTLMESAGRAAVAFTQKNYGPLEGKRVLCLCGKGNNGGDGLVFARSLVPLGAELHVFLLGRPESMTEEAARNYVLLEKLSGHDDNAHLFIYTFESITQLDDLPPADIIVDALLGTGTQEGLRTPYDAIVNWINQQDAYVLSMDIPTGLHADTGTILGTAIQADHTIAMGALKAGLCIGEGPDRVGRLDVAEIGIPGFIIEQMADQYGCSRIPSLSAIQAWLPHRSRFAHKYSVGMALIVAGSKGLTGAATLASRAAEQSGVGAVVCATPEEVQPVLATKMTEVMTVGLPHSDEGINTPQAQELLAAPMQKAGALLVGCGMGQKSETQAFIRTLVTQTRLPVVLDADGLNAFQGHIDLIQEHSAGNWILTPHVGEFKRLVGPDINLEHKIDLAREYAQAWNCILILKGAPSIVASPDGKTFINPTGNNALATAGTGDVLAGLCVGLLAQGVAPLHAALCALHIGGTAAENFAIQHHTSTMRASDLIEHIRIVLSERYYI